jgi:hypothetical protein
VANEWNKTASVEFETMLRRHLRSGAAPVSACAGFDLDAASEYLEGALDEWRRASYESHLAGCAICRRHLIELARLAEAAPSFESRPAAAPDRIPARDRWKEVVAGWFDLSTWNLKWKIAGASGVAFAILIAALGAQSWLYTYNHAELAFRGDSATSAPSAESVVQPVPSPTPELSSPYAAAPGTQDLAVSSPARTEVPAPSVGLVADAPKVPLDASSAARALIENQPPAAPVPANDNRLTAAERNAQRLSGGLEELSAVANTARSGAKAAQETADQDVAAPPNSAPRGAQTGQSPHPQTRAGAIVQISKGGESVLGVGEPPKGEAAKDGAGGPGISPPPFRGGLVGVKSELRAKPEPERPRLKPRVLPDIKIWSLAELMKRSLAPFGKSDSDTESERKAKPDKQEASGDESPKPMTWRMRGKVFVFDKGTWIDQEYKPEMQEWRVWPLTRDSEEYKRVLRDEPVLKEFFDKGPILIVWKNRTIYKVLK